jgi:hypothetical protein
MVDRANILLGMFNRINDDIKLEPESTLTAKINHSSAHGYTVCLRIVLVPVSKVPTYLSRMINGLSFNDALCLLGTMSQTQVFQRDCLTQEKKELFKYRTIYVTLSLGKPLHEHLAKSLGTSSAYHVAEKFIEALQGVINDRGKA